MSQTVTVPASTVTEVISVPADAIRPKPLIPVTELLKFTRNKTVGWSLVHPEFPDDGIPFSPDDHDKYQAGSDVWKRDMLLREFADYANLLRKWGIQT